MTATGLRLLAGYPLHRDAFGLTPAGFAALFGAISPFRRADQTVPGDEAVPGLEQTERSFMASLFDENAPAVHRLVAEGNTSIRDEALRTLVARGFGLSTLELETVVDALDDGFALSEGVDARGLAALYRMVTLCRLLGWPILSGLALMERIGDELGDAPSLWATLTRRNRTEAETDALCSAVEWLADLARWMGEAELTPNQLLELALPPSVDGALASDADVAWFDELARAYAPVAVRTETFIDFEPWLGGSVFTDTWWTHMTGDGAICDDAGVFLQGVAWDEIDAACRACLLREGIDPDAKGTDPDAEGNADRLLDLVVRLAALRDRQERLIEAQVAGLDARIGATSVDPFLRWMQTEAFDLLRTVLPGTADDAARSALAELRRHVAVVTTFELGDVDLAMLGPHPRAGSRPACSMRTAPRVP